MCTSCFLDHELISSLGNVEMHALSVQKLLKVLTENYKIYAQNKMKVDWPPTQIDSSREKIRKRVQELEKLVSHGIEQITRYLEKSMKDSICKIKSINHDKNLSKLLNFIGEEDEV